MSKSKKRTFSPEFKARIALEAARGAKTANEIAAENEIHPVQVSQWKRDLLEGASSLFERASSSRKREKEQDREKRDMERKIGQLTIEVDWLREKSKQLGL